VLKRTPVTKDIIVLARDGRAHSIKTYRAVFGEFRVALGRAGLTASYPRPYPKEQIIEELKTLRKELGRPLLKRDIKAAAKEGAAPSFYFMRRMFGSVSKALAAAGAGQARYTTAEIIGILRQIDAKLERPVQRSDINRLHREGKGPSFGAVKNRFGSLEKARRAAGVKSLYPAYGSRKQKYWQKYAPADLISQLKSLSKRLGKPPRHDDLNRASKEGASASARPFVRCFGSIAEAHRAAGLGTKFEPHRGKAK
jgi:hypothetical protein